MWRRLLAPIMALSAVITATSVTTIAVDAVRSPPAPYEHVMQPAQPAVPSLTAADAAEHEEALITQAEAREQSSVDSDDPDDVDDDPEDCIGRIRADLRPETALNVRFTGDAPDYMFGVHVENYFARTASTTIPYRCTIIFSPYSIAVQPLGVVPRSGTGGRPVMPAATGRR